MNEKRTETLKKLLRKINHECHICGTKSETCYLSTKDYLYSCKKFDARSFYLKNPFLGL